MASVETPGRDEVERLLEASIERRQRRLSRREYGFELALTAVFLLGCGVLLLSGEGPIGAETITLAFVVAYAIASRVDYPIATGVAVPTQLFLVALFAHADARLVPLLAMGGLLLGTLVAILRGQSRWDRLVMPGGDATYVLGPAIVLTATGNTDAAGAPWLVVVGAFTAQCVVEYVAAEARDWYVLRLRPQVQALVMAQVWAFDAALTPVGIMAVAVAESASLPWAPLALLPLVALVAYTARDRTERIDRLHDQVEALGRERRRLQVAVRRIGDAFASNLDLEALVTITTRASSEALDATAGRGSAVVGNRPEPACSTGDALRLDRLLHAAEAACLSTQGPAEFRSAEGWALAAPVGLVDRPVAVIAVARDTTSFAPEERELLVYLAEQASVSAAGVAEHQALQQEARAARAELEQRVIDRTAELAERTAAVEALYAEVTEQAMELRAVSREQEIGLRDLAHEVRGPLYAGEGLLELLLAEAESAADAQRRADLLSLRGTMREALRIVDEQLENARLRAGALRPPRFEPVDLRGLLTELSGTFRALHQPEAVSFTVEIAPETPEILTDRHFLGQAVRNLLTNASKFTDRGEITVRAIPTGRDRVRIEVADTGTGIATEDHARIFEDFGQVDTAQEHRPAGTGLGLPLVRRLVAALGGTVSLESAPGVGSTFAIELPVGTAPAWVPGGADATATRTQRPFKSGRRSSSLS